MSRDWDGGLEGLYCGSIQLGLVDCWIGRYADVCCDGSTLKYIFIVNDAGSYVLEVRVLLIYRSSMHMLNALGGLLSVLVFCTLLGDFQGVWILQGHKKREEAGVR